MALLYLNAVTNEIRKNNLLYEMLSRISWFFSIIDLLNKKMWATKL